MFSDEPEYDPGCMRVRISAGELFERFFVGVADEEGKCLAYGFHFLDFL